MTAVTNPDAAVVEVSPSPAPVAATAILNPPYADMCGPSTDISAAVTAILNLAKVIDLLHVQSFV